jgi:hypothetical protein
LAILIGAAVAAPCLADDIGTPDTCRFTSGTWIISGEEDSLFSVELWGWHDDTLIRAASLPFKVSFDTAGFDPEEWNVHLDTLEYLWGGEQHVDSYYVWLSTADSFIVVDTFIFSEDLETLVLTYGWSAVDSTNEAATHQWYYNGLIVGLIDYYGPIFDAGVSTKIGDLYLKITDPGRLPDSFHIEVDSFFYPPGGFFKYSPIFAEVGHPPEFTKSVITVIQVSSVCGDVNATGDVDLDDAVYLINFIFSEGAAPEPYESADADCSGIVDIDDVVWLILYIFSGGGAPCDTDGDGVPDC